MRRQVLAVCFLLLIGVSRLAAETVLNSVEMTDVEFKRLGLTNADIIKYRELEGSIEKVWWGHLSPLEQLMYAAKTEKDRRKYARKYLSSNFPKAKAERASYIAMRAVARELARVEDAPNRIVKNNRIVFVNVACGECKPQVREFVQNNEAIVDIYVIGLDTTQSLEEQLVSWARSARLPEQGVTLNPDKGVFLKSRGTPLATMEIIK